MNLRTILALNCLALVVASESRAAISFTGSYSQNFDALAITGSANAWANDSTLAGWHLFNSAGAGIPTYRAAMGSEAVGAFYSFGSAGATERALGGVGAGTVYFGSPASGAAAGYIAVALMNGTLNSFNSFTLSFAGEQWRNAGNVTAQKMALQYGFGSTVASVATWNTPGGLFDYTSPVTSAAAGAVNGNVAGRVTGLGGTVSGLNWLAGDTLWIRWIENNDASDDHGLAIDDFSIAATTSNVAVPEPSTYLAGLLLALPFGVHGVRYLRNQKRA